MKFEKELLDEIDRILKLALKNGVLSWFSVNSNELGKTAWRVCKSFNFLYLKDDRTAELNQNGINVLQEGGIEKYLNNIESKKTLEKTIKVLTSKRLKYDVLYNIMYVLIGGIIGLVTVLALPSNSEKYIKELHKSASDKSEHNDSLRKHLTDKNILILELKTELDSLKR